MRIHSITLTNFGLYRGVVKFDLRPTSEGLFNRPIVAITGKNGVGKSTLMEALRVGLHGPLALGHRVSRADYQRYIFSHLHRAKADQQPASEASVEIEFDYVRAARRANYVVTRHWKLNGDKVDETVGITENGDVIPEVDNQEQAEIFLRELLPPPVADLFFFDGERFETLAEETASTGVLAETVKGLLGLDLVEQLRKDLDVFISRQTPAGVATDESLEALDTQLNRNETQAAELGELQRTVAHEIGKLQDAIARLEARLVREGKHYAENRGALRLERQQLEQDIQQQRKAVQDLCTNLLPFAITPKYCRAVVHRLKHEAEKGQQVASGVELQRQLDDLTDTVLEADFWREMKIDKRYRRQIYGQIRELVKSETEPSSETSITVIPVSEPERQNLLNRFQLALTDAPRQFTEATQRLESLEKQLAKIKRAQDKTPPDSSLQPLVAELGQLNRRLGELQKTQQDYIIQQQSLGVEARLLEQKRRAAQQLAGEQNKQNKKVQLAINAQEALVEYATRLTQAKLQALERHLVDHFNLLCRKKEFIEAAHFSPEDYSLTLQRAGQPFLRERLSAGERQVLAVALMWALHEVSGLPLPVMIDTPLARLDSDHRRSLVDHYFPHGSHQMILLGTDLEMDDKILRDLTPSMARWYHLTYNAAVGAVEIEEHRPAAVQEVLPL